MYCFREAHRLNGGLPVLTLENYPVFSAKNLFQKIFINKW